MKQIILITAIVLLAGCTTPNPAYTPPVPGQTNNVPAFIPDPRIGSISNVVAQIAAGVAPANPYSGLTDYAVKGIFGLTGLIAGALAAARNKNAVIDTLAAGVVKAGAVPAVLDHASDTPSYSAVATAINNNVGANQTPAGKG